MSEYRTDTNESAAQSQADEVSRVTADEVKTRMERGEPIAFVDSRSDHAWSSSSEQIRGSIRVPPQDAASHLAEVPKDRSIVVYCT